MGAAAEERGQASRWACITRVLWNMHAASMIALDPSDQSVAETERLVRGKRPRKTPKHSLWPKKWGFNKRVGAAGELPREPQYRHTSGNSKRGTVSRSQMSLFVAKRRQMPEIN